MKRRLTITAPNGVPTTRDLDDRRLTLGRSRDNDLCFPEDASLSRRHLELFREGEEWIVRDLGSRNGTVVNGVGIDGPATLRPGDAVTAGRLTLRFETSEPAVTDPPIEFVGGAGQAAPAGVTLMASLDGLLSGEPGASRPEVASASGAFRSPVVMALIRAGRELAGSRPLHELFRLILDLSIRAVGAERGLLMTLEGDTLEVRARHGDGFRISSAVRDRVLGERASLLVRDVEADDAFRRRLSLSEQHVRTLMAAPLQTDHGVLGLVYVDSRLAVRDFTPDDLNLLTVLANVAAIRIEHQRLIEVERAERRWVIERDQAATIQRGILPSRAPEVPGWDLAGYNAPCSTVGGDYYDFLVAEDGPLGLALGDVAGKGMPAAILMSNLQARVQALSEAIRDPAELMTRLDQGLATRCPANRFITLFYGLLDPARGELHYCNAGHNPPLVVRGHGAVETLPGGGTVLGILPEVGYDAGRVRLEPGDLLALFSDGVTEATDGNGEEFGEARLAELVRDLRQRSAAEAIDEVNEALARWTGGAPAADDLTLMFARRVG